MTVKPAAGKKTYQTPPCAAKAALSQAAMVDFRVQTVSGKRLSVTVAGDASAREVCQECSRATSIARDTLKLVYQGKTITENGAPPPLEQGCLLLAFVKPPAPPVHLSELADGVGTASQDDDEDVWSFASKIPARFWVRLVGWMMGLVAFSYVGHAVPYLLLSAGAAMFANLGHRKEGEASAYSIFNGFRELPGQLNANHFEQAIRRGEMIGIR